MIFQSHFIILLLFTKLCLKEVRKTLIECFSSKCLIFLHAPLLDLNLIKINKKNKNIILFTI